MFVLTNLFPKRSITQNDVFYDDVYVNLININWRVYLGRSSMGPPIYFVLAIMT